MPLGVESVREAASLSANAALQRMSSTSSHAIRPTCSYKSMVARSRLRRRDAAAGDQGCRA